MIRSIRLLLALVILAPAASLCAQEPSGMDERSRGEWVHRDAALVFRTPPGWLAITPQRLRRDSKTTVMGVERIGDLRAIVNVSFSPLETRKFSDSISLTADTNGDFGEEYAMLRAVYGKDRVGKPTSQVIGAFNVIKIRIESGPIPEDQSVGIVYLFETGGTDRRWKVKVRANYPKISETLYTEQLEAVLRAFVSDLK